MRVKKQNTRIFYQIYVINIDNTQIICLALNLAKNEYVISNDTILDIIKNIYSNISNF